MMIVCKLIQKEHTQNCWLEIAHGTLTLESSSMHDDLQSFSSSPLEADLEVESLECHPVVVGGDHICIQSLEEPPRK